MSNGKFVIALTSKSPIKVATLNRLFGPLLDHFKLMLCPTVDLPTAEQPINSAEKCAGLRLDNIAKHYQIPADAILISIENGMVTVPEDTKWIYDVASVTIEFKGKRYSAQSDRSHYWAHVPYKWYLESKERMVRENPSYVHAEDGLDITMGKSHIGPFLDREAPGKYSHDNWSGYPEFGGFDRKDQIFDALLNTFSMFLYSCVRLTNDFPKPPVIFQDLGQIMANPMLNQIMTCLIIGKIRHLGWSPTKIVGLDARGFIYGSVIANFLGAGFVMARKAGKQPERWGLESVGYQTEYSVETLQIESKLLGPDDQVLIWDDLFATGGTVDACVNAVKRCGVPQNNVHVMCALKVDALFDNAVRQYGMVPFIVLSSQ